MDCELVRTMLSIPISVVCCDSCHNEEEDGYDWAGSDIVLEGQEYIVCCAIKNWLRDNWPARCIGG